VSDAKTHLSRLEQQLRYRDRIIYLLMILLALFGVGWLRMPTLLNVHVPPDLSRPQLIKPNEIWPANVFAFAENLMTQLHYCHTDCAQDYLANLEAERHYITERCMADLRLHKQRNESLYAGRTRRLLPATDGLFDPKNVIRLGKDAWEVHLEFDLEEHVKGIETRNRRYHYPVRIVHYAVPLESNPFQLAFDCYLPPGPQPADAVAS
jgi:integrating conjugative element protein (TIGR03746 family)